MQEDSTKILSRISGTKIIFPIIIGIAVAVYMLYNEYRHNEFPDIQISYTMIMWITVAWLMMALRDFGYMLRIRILTVGDLNWRQAFNITMIWEFTSAITPSMIGGTSIAVLFFNREGISIGRSSAIVMATSFLDQLYFSLFFPIFFLLVGPEALFTIGSDVGSQADVLSFTNMFFYFAIVGYSLMLAYTAVVFYGLFVNPRGLKRLLWFIFQLPLIRKWRRKAAATGVDLAEASVVLRTQGWLFWLKAFGATIFAWSGRYLIVNFLLLAFGGGGDQFLIYTRQFVMWIMMIVSPTPGGSGFAEYVFSSYLSEFIPVGIAGLMAFLWRLISYYPYLFIGAIILPRWIKNRFAKTNTKLDD